MHPSHLHSIHLLTRALHERPLATLWAWTPWLLIECLRAGWVIATFAIRPRTPLPIVLFTLIWIIGKALEQLVMPRGKSQEGKPDGEGATGYRGQANSTGKYRGAVH